MSSHADIVDIAFSGQVVELIKMLDAGFDVDYQKPDGTYAALVAVANNNTEMLKVLLNYNANLSLQDSLGRSAKDMMKQSNVWNDFLLHK